MSNEWVVECFRVSPFCNAKRELQNVISSSKEDITTIQQLQDVIKGGIRTPESEKRRFGNLVFAALTIPVLEIRSLLEKLANKESEVQAFLKDKKLENNLTKAHVTLAHKRSHGVTTVAAYTVYHQQKVPVEFVALLFSDNFAALEARIGSINGEKRSSKNEWPHATIWTGEGTMKRIDHDTILDPMGSPSHCHLTLRRNNLRSSTFGMNATFQNQLTMGDL